MRETRYFESDYAEGPACLVAARPLTITTQAGILWVTIDERPGDHWLKPGETISLATGESAWVGAGADRAVWVLAAEAAKAHGSLAVWTAHLLRSLRRMLSAGGGQGERVSARESPEPVRVQAPSKR